MTLPPKVADWLDEWEERAAILEFMANRTRAQADEEAEAIVRRRAAGAPDERGVLSVAFWRGGA